MKKYSYLIMFLLMLLIFNSCKKVTEPETMKIESTKSISNTIEKNSNDEESVNDDENEKSDNIFRWSDPVNGLIARIEGVYRENCNDDVIFIGLKNVGETDIEVPTCNPTKRSNGVFFKVMYDVNENNEIHWKTIESYDDESYQNRSGNRIDRSNRILKEGESAIVFLCGRFGEVVENSTKLKVIFEIEESVNNTKWYGKIETPTFPLPLQYSYDEYKNYYESLEFPTYFPEFSSEVFIGCNAPLFLSQGYIVDGNFSSNYVLYRQLRLYKQKLVENELEKRFINLDINNILKFLYAALLARSNNESARNFLVESRKSTDYYIQGLTLGALKIASQIDTPAEWILDELLASLEDDRELTKLPKYWYKNQTLKISYMANENEYIPLLLGHKKFTKAVPVFIRLIKKTKEKRHYISALGKIGDKRAIPPLLELLEHEFEKVNWKKDTYLYDTIDNSIYALRNLEAKEAIPLFIKYIHYPNCIEALVNFKEKKAIEPLKKIVNSNGIVEGVNNSNREYVKDRLESAKIAIAVLSDDPTPELCILLFDMKLGEYKRRDVVGELGYHPDKRAIPYLVKAIKNDPSGSVVNTAIRALAFYKYKDAVKGLIECFDANFEGKNDWKRAYTPKMFQDSVAESLREITSQKIGTDKALWQKWFEEEGKTDSTLE